MDDDNIPKTDVHIDLYQYQYDYFREYNYVIAATVRDLVDDWMISQGTDPERYAKTKRE